MCGMHTPWSWSGLKAAYTLYVCLSDFPSLVLFPCMDQPHVRPCHSLSLDILPFERPSQNKLQALCFLPLGGFSQGGVVLKNGSDKIKDLNDVQPHSDFC